MRHVSGELAGEFPRGLFGKFWGEFCSSILAGAAAVSVDVGALSDDAGASFIAGAASLGAVAGASVVPVAGVSFLSVAVVLVVFMVVVSAVASVVSAVGFGFCRMGSMVKLGSAATAAAS